MSRVTAIEILRPGPPGEGMDPGQVAELEAFKARTDPGAAGADFQHTAYLGSVPVLADAQYLDARLAGVKPGVGDVRDAFVALLALGRPVFLGEGTIPFLSGLTIPDNAVIKGSGRGKTILSHQFNGDFLTMGNNVTLEDLTIEGNGATYTGQGMVFPAGKGKQKFNRVEVINFDGPCLYFTGTGGSQFEAVQLTAYRVSAGTGTGRYAIVIEDTQVLSAVPRSFLHLQTGGQCAISFGGSNNTEVVSSIVADLAFSAESRGVNISSSRILNQTALTVNGHGVTIVGCDVLPQITIAPGADSIIIGPNAYNNLPVIDNSGNPRNQVTHHALAYTPTLTTNGNPPSLGNGALTGGWSRTGTQVKATIQLVVGSTTNLGTGELRFGLPQKRHSGSVDYCGIGVIAQGSTLTQTMANIPGAVGYVRLSQAGAGGSVTFNSPVTLADGDTIRIGITYNM